jgi:hypothetical protein
MGQNINDLVRYSNIQLQGSARFESMAGSFGALGADISSSLVNPAGYGRFSSSQFNLGLNFNNIQNTNTFQEVVTETYKNVVRPSNFGIVLANDVSSNNKGFLYNQLGFTYNRVDNLTNNIAYKGKLFYSLLDNFAAQAQGLDPSNLNPFTSLLAYEMYTIDNDTDNIYKSRLLFTDTMFQNRDITTKGGISEYTFSYSTNYLNKLYIGINWGIRTIRYSEDYVHSEHLEQPSALSLLAFDYTYNQTTRGSGNNFKIGAIYLPFESLRLGLALHTPTYYNLTDEWSTNMISYHKGDTVYQLPDGTNPIGNFKYRLRTPSKIIGSVAYVFGTSGALNIDVEYMDYKWANLKNAKELAASSYNFKYQNEEAELMLRPVFNVRVGGEINFHSQYFLRGGFAYYPQPYKTDFADGTSGSINYSLGGGIKFGGSSLDLAYKIQSRKYNYYAFDASLTSISSITQGIVLCYSISF